MTAYWSPHFFFRAPRPQYGTVLDSKSGHVPHSPHGKIWMALGKPTLMISMRLAVAYVNGITMSRY
jgi:hypothetical protein